MITPFRMIKNQYLRENKTHEDIYWKSVFTDFTNFLEYFFLNQYNILNNDIKRSRLQNIERFAKDFSEAESIESFLNNNMRIEKKDMMVIFNNGNYSLIIHSYVQFLKIFEELKKNFNKRKIMLCFNLTPIREP